MQDREEPVELALREIRLRRIIRRLRTERVGMSGDLDGDTAVGSIQTGAEVDAGMRAGGHTRWSVDERLRRGRLSRQLILIGGGQRDADGLLTSLACGVLGLTRQVH